MSSKSASAPRPFWRWTVKLHRWLSIGAAVFWLIQAVTGVFLSFHFEIEDAAITTASRPTDLAALEQRIDAMETGGGEAKVHWIWTSAGLPDRYVILFSDASGELRTARIDGGGDILRDRAADDLTFLGLMREIHLTLLSGKTGHWILAITGLLLVSNLIMGLIVAWPRRGTWRAALFPAGKGTTAARHYVWHRAIGLWAVIPGIVIVATGTLILFEHQIRDVLGVPEITLPANPPEGPGVGFVEAYQAAVEAIPGSRFVGTTIPTAEDASYYAWVRAPGELYRGGYGGSLVIVDGNDGSVRGAYPALEGNAAQLFVYSLYPLHTGENAGFLGRFLTMMLGVWLAVILVLGLLLWLKRRPARKAAEAGRAQRAASAEI